MAKANGLIIMPMCFCCLYFSQTYSQERHSHRKVRTIEVLNLVANDMLETYYVHRYKVSLSSNGGVSAISVPCDEESATRMKEGLPKPERYVLSARRPMEAEVLWNSDYMVVID